MSKISRLSSADWVPAACAAGIALLLPLACKQNVEPAPAQPGIIRPSEPGPATPATRPAASREEAKISANAEDIVAIAAGSVEVDGKKGTVSAFGIDRTEVTVANYEECVKAGACSPAKADHPYCNGGAPGEKAMHPINCVTFSQAQLYCQYRKARLPTEAEWQLAAGGPERRPFPWGNDRITNLWADESPRPGMPPAPGRYNLCWVGDGTDETHPYPKATCPVGSYSRGNTPSGIADMAGNVWEWTSSSQRLPDGDSWRRLKGGGFNYDPMGPPDIGVVTNTLHDDDYQAPDVGFRCVR